MRGSLRRRRPKRLGDDRLATAHHEAGHAVVAIRLGIRFHHVTIKADDDSLGHVLARKWFDHRWRPDIAMTPVMRDRFERRIVVLLSGGAAEARFKRTPKVRGVTDDYSQAIRLAERIASLGPSLEKYLAWLSVVASDRVEIDWKSIRALALRLNETETLSEDDCRGVTFRELAARYKKQE